MVHNSFQLPLAFYFHLSFTGFYVWFALAGGICLLSVCTLCLYSFIVMWICEGSLIMERLNIPGKYDVGRQDQWKHIHLIYSNARQVCFLKFGASICEFVLNFHMKCWTGPLQTGLLWTGPCGAELWLASPNHHVRSLLFWDITKCRFVNPYQHLRTSERSHLQGSRNPKKKEHTIIEVNWHDLFMGLCPHHLIF